MYELIGYVSLERIPSSFVRQKSVGKGAQRMQINILLFISVSSDWFTLLEDLALVCTWLRTEET